MFIGIYKYRKYDKKDLSSVTTDLAALAADIQSQRVVPPETEDQGKAKREEGAKRKEDRTTARTDLTIFIRAS